MHTMLAQRQSALEVQTRDDLRPVRELRDMKDKMAASDLNISDLLFKIQNVRSVIDSYD